VIGTYKPEYIGHPDQCLGVGQGVFAQGKQDGVKFIHVSNGSGLEATILPDRGLDVYQARFNGKNCGFIYPCGIVHPSYFARTDEGWIDTFTAGFLTTCGLTYTGPGVRDEGMTTSLHGVIGNMPAAQVNVFREIVGGAPQVRITGEVYEHLCGANMSMAREITIRHGVNEICLRDTVRNCGYRRSPHMIVYHCNLGYPLISETASIELDSRAARGRTPRAQRDVDKWREIQPPQDEFEEMCFYHDVARGEDGFAAAGVRNPAEGAGISIRYDAGTLDQFVQWCMYAKGEYVLGLEPCNATIDGRDDARNNGTLKYLEAGQSVTHTLSFGFYQA